MNREELAWAVGLFEGEGCIGCWNNTPSGKQIVARIVMNDEDVLDRFVSAVVPIKCHVYRSPRLYGKENRRRFSVSLTNFEKVQALIAMFWPWLGQRRQEQAKLALSSYKAYYGWHYRRVDL